MFDDLPLNQKQKRIDIWIQHIKTAGKHSFPIIHMLTHIRYYFLTNFTAVTKWWLTYQNHLICDVWWSSTQPKAKMIWYLDSTHQNSWKTLSYAHTHEKLISNLLLQQWQMVVQVTKTHIILCLIIFQLRHC